MMKKICLLILIMVLGKISYSQYPIQQFLGADSAIVTSKGGLQGRLIPIVITDTNAANAQRMKAYPGAQLYTTNGNFYIRNSNATKWILVSGGNVGPINIYNSDGTLTGNRELDGAGNFLRFNTISEFGVGADSVVFNSPIQRYFSGSQSFILSDSLAKLTRSGSATFLVNSDNGAARLLLNPTGPPDEKKYEIKALNEEFSISQVNDAETTADTIINIVTGGNVGIKRSTPDSVLTVGGGIHATGGLKIDNLISSPGTKALRINAQGQVSIADTTLGGGTVTNVATNNGSGITGGPITTTGTLAIDTTNVIATKASVTGGLAGKLNISDTASMLTPYLRKADTTSMLSPYFHTAGVGLKSAGQTVYADTLLLSTRAWRQKGIDSVVALIAGLPSGTVTSVATNNGTGITGGTITTSGTLAIDTTVISTRAWRQKGVDSLQANINGKLNISDTASMLQNYVNNVGYGLGKTGQTVYADSASLSNYYLRRKDSLTTTNPLGYVTKTILADTAAAIRSSSVTGFVPYTGATQNVDLGQFGLKTKYVEFDTSSQAVTDRRLQWSNDDGTLQFGMTNGGSLTQRIGLEQFARVKNVDAVQINKGQAVYIYGASGDRASVKLADNRNDSTSSKTLGVAAEDIPVNDVGFVGTFGVVSNLNLSTFAPGDILYLDSVPGQLTKTKPQAPYHLVFIGVVERANSGNGLLFVNPQNGYELDELHNVRITSPVPNKAILLYDSVAKLWVDTTVAASGIAVTQVNTNSATGITGGPITTTGTISADTLLLSTRAWRQKGVDSVASLINTNVSGTTNRVSKFTGAHTIGNSSIADSSSGVAMVISPSGNIGLGSATNPQKNLEIENASPQVQLRYSPSKKMDLGRDDFNGVIDVYNGTNTPIELQIQPTGGTTKLFGPVTMSGLSSGAGSKALRISNLGVISYADTLIDAGGTVTSVATNIGTGITGGTITTSGTLAIDTLLISTRAWRQKGIDSVASLINTNVSGTTNYIPKFTSSSAIGNSVIYESGGSIGIGTTSPVSISGYTALTINNATTGGILTFQKNGSNIGSIYNGATDITIGVNTGATIFENNGSERMRLDASGNLAIGTSSTGFNPAGLPLIVGSGTGNTGMTIFSGSSSYGSIHFADAATTGAASYVGYINYDHSGNSMQFGTNATEKMRLDASGNLGIGTTSPSEKLEVEGRIKIRSGYALYLSNGDNTATSAIVNGESTSTSSTLFYTGGAERMRITSGGNVGIGTTSITNPISFIRALNISGGDAGIIFSNTNGTAKNWSIGAIDAGSFVFFDGSTERMRITSAGNVGIGTSSPLQTTTNRTVLTVNGTNSAIVNLGIGGSLGSYMYADASGGTYETVGTNSISANGANRIDFSTNGSERMRITSAGNVGIGTSNPQSALSLAGGSTISIATTDGSDNSYMLISGGGAAATGRGAGIVLNGNDRATYGGQLEFFTGDAATGYMTFSTGNNAERMRITSGGSINFSALDNPTVYYFGYNRPDATNLKINGTNNNKLQLQNAEVDVIVLNTNGNSYLNGGNVGIGTTNPTRKLYIDDSDVWMAIKRTSNREYLLGLGTTDNFRIYDGTAGTDRMVITSGGNVGIGTTSPQAILSVKGSTNNTVIEFENGGASKAFMRSYDRTAGAYREYEMLADYLLFSTGSSPSERMRITSGGSLLLGTTTDKTTIIGASGTGQTIGGSGTTNLAIWNTGNADWVYSIAVGNDGTVYNYNKGNTPMLFSTNATERMRITSAGEVYIAGTTDQGAYNLQVNGTGVWGAGAYVDGSDSALKKNIQPLANSLEIIKQMKPVTYEYKPSYSNDTAIQAGFIAQDLQQVLGNQVYRNGVVKEGGAYLGVAYQQIIPLLVKAIQEQQAQIEQLKAQINK